MRISSWSARSGAQNRSAEPEHRAGAAVELQRLRHADVTPTAALASLEEQWSFSGTCSCTPALQQMQPCSLLPTFNPDNRSNKLGLCVLLSVILAATSCSKTGRATLGCFVQIRKPTGMRLFGLSRVLHTKSAITHTVDRDFADRFHGREREITML